MRIFNKIYFIPFLLTILVGIELKAQCPPTLPSSVNFSPTPFCGGHEIALTASPVQPNYIYEWSFDDGSGIIETGNPSSHQFPIFEGDVTYNVTLTVTDTLNNCSNIVANPITILNTPEFQITGVFSACLPSFSSVTTFTPTFNIVGGDPGAVYDWDFGDGTTLLGTMDVSVTHTYTDYGTYDLVVSSGNGTCVGIQTQAIAFYKRPTASMSIVGDPDICEGGTIEVQNNTNPDDVVFYVWDWGDGTMDTLYDNSNNSHIYLFEDDVVCNSPPPAGAEYNITLIAVNDCLQHSNTSPIFVSLLPRAIIDQPDTLCLSDPTQTFGNLSCPSPSSGYFDMSTYLWDFGDGTTSTEPNPTHTFPGLGTYEVTLEATNGCGTANDTVEIVVIEDPMADADVTTNTSDFCIPFEASFVDMSTGFEIETEWNITPATGWTYINGTDATSANPEIEITQIGSYTATLTATNYCGSSTWDTTLLAITDPTIGLDPIGFFCDTTTINPSFTANNGNSPNTTYDWQFPGGIPASATGATPPSVFYGAIGNYTVSVTITNECNSMTDMVSFLIDPTPPADAGPDLEFCVDDMDYQFNATPAGGEYSGTAITVNGLFSPSSAGAGNFQIFYENLNLDCPTYDTVDIVVHALPIVDGGPSQSICLNAGMLTLTGATPIGGFWSGTGITDGAAGTFNPTITGVGNFSVTYSYTNPITNCTDTDTKLIDVIGLPFINAGNTLSLCNINQDLQITGYSPFGGTWTGTGITDASQGLFNPAVAGGNGNYTVTYSFTDVNNCTNSDDLIIIVSDLPTVNAGPDDNVCINEPQFNLSGNSPAGGTWAGPGITNSTQGSFYAQGAGIGTHELIYTVGIGDCAVSDTLEMQVFGIPVVNAGNDESVCADANAFNLMGYSPLGGTWSGTGITDAILGTFDPTTAGVGTHTLTYTYVDIITNCSETDFKILTVFALPSVEAGNPIIYCNTPDNITLSGYSPLGGVWSGTGIVDPANGVFNANTAGGVGNYQVTYTYTDPNTCVSSDVLDIEVIAPTAVEAGLNDTVCIDNGVFVQSGYTPFGGNWSGPGILNSAGGLFDPSLAGEGTHTLTYTYGVGSCINTDTKDIYVAPLPTITTGTDFAVCLNDMAFTIPGFSPTDGVWTGTGITDPSGIFDPSISGAGTFTLTLSYTDPLTLCQNSSILNITVNSLPVVEAGNPVSYCNTNDNITLDNYFPAGGTWSGSGVIDGSAGIFNSASAGGVGMYDLVYSFTDGNNCTNTDTLEVTVIDADVIDLGMNDTICIDNGVFVQVGYSPFGGTWSGPGIINPSGGLFDPTVSGIGLHTLFYTIGTGTCQQQASKTIFVADLPNVDAGMDEQVCVDAMPFTLSGNTPLGGAWTGTGVDVAGLFDPALAGVGSHTLTYTYADPINNCINSNTKAILVTPLPVVSVGDTVVYCDNPNDIQLTGFSPLGGTWSGTGIIDPVNGVFNSGTAGGIGMYEAVYSYTDINNCTNTDTLIIDIILGDIVDAGLDTAFCIDNGLYNLFGFSPPGGTWSGTGIIDADGIFDPLASGSGLHTLTYTFGTGTCLKTDTKNILVGNIPIVNAGPNEIGCSADMAYNLTGFSPANGVWTGNGITDPVGTFDPAVAGGGIHTLTYTFTDITTGCEASNTKEIDLEAAPIVEAGIDTTVCISSQDIVLLDNSPLGGVWTGTGIIDAINGVFNTTAAGGPGDYVLTYGFTSSNGCYNEDTLTIMVIPAPVIDPGLDTALCIDAGLFNMNDFTPLGGIWSGTGIIDADGIFDPLAAGLGLHILTYTYGEGTCEVSDTRTILVGTNPIANAGDDQIVCENAPQFTLQDFSPQGGYWTGAGIVDSFDFDPGLLGVGTYTITYNYTNEVTGCEVSDTRDITIQIPPVVNVPDTTVYCNSFDDVTFSGYSPTGGLWSGPGVINQTTGVFNTTIAGGEGQYILYYEFSNPNGCEVTDSMVIDVVFGDTVVAGNDFGLCIDDSAVPLSGFSPIGGVWTGNGITDPNGVFDPVIAGEGFHTLTYTFGVGTCEKIDDIQVFVGAEPAVVAGPNEVVCVSISAFTLSGFNPPDGTWTGIGITDPLGTFDPTIAGIGIHTLTYTYTNPLSGCTGMDTKTVEVVPLPFVNAGDTLEYCNNPNDIFLIATPIGGIWSGSGIVDPLNGIFNTNVAGGVGEYELIYTVTQNNGCNNTDTLIIEVLPAPNVDAGLTDTICLNDGLLTLSGFSPLGGVWSGPGVVDPNVGTFNPTIVGEGTHSISYTFGTGTCEVSDVKDVFVGALPQVTVGADLEVCIGDVPFDMMGFSPTGGIWSGNGITDASLGTFDPALAGVGMNTLTYSFTNALTGCSSQANLIIDVTPLPAIIVTDTVEYCNSVDTIALDPASPVGGIWSGPGVVDGTIGTFNSLLAGGIGQYDLIYEFSDGSGCVNTDTIVVDVIFGDTVTAGQNLIICISDGVITFDDVSPAGGTWSGPGMVDPSLPIFNPDSSGIGTHIVTYTYGSGTCEKTDTKEITVGSIPTVDAGQNDTLCLNTPAFLIIGQSPTGGTWTGNGVDALGNFDPIAVGVGDHILTYTFVNTLTGCEASGTKTITIVPLPIVTVADTLTYCVSPNTVSLTGFSPTGGIWTGPGIVDPLGGFNGVQAGGIGVYDLAYTFTDTTGCIASDTTTVVVEEGPLLDIGLDEAVCIDNGVHQLSTFTPFGGSWSGAGIIDSLNGVFHPDSAGVGIHVLTYTFGTGTCERTEVKNIEVFPLPFVDVGPDVTVCEDEDSYVLTPTPIGGTWTGQGLDTMGNFDPQAVGLGTYEWVYTFTNATTNCINTDTLNITVVPQPAAGFSHPLAVCENEQVEFISNATGADSYIWNYGNGDADTVNIDTVYYTYTNAGIYDVEMIAISANGCTDTISSSIEVSEVPIAAFATSPDSGCAPLEVAFADMSTGIGLDYFWDFGNGLTSILATPDTVTFAQSTVDTFYVVSLTVNNQCGTSTAVDTVHVAPIPIVEFGPDVSSGCTPLEVNFSNTSQGLAENFFWDFGDGTFSSDSIPPPHTFTTIGNVTETYTVTLIASNQCGADTSTTEIIVTPTTVSSFFNVDVTEGCRPLTVDFTNLSSAGSTAQWNFGEGSTSVFQNPTHTFDTSGVFTVTLYSFSDCGVDSSMLDITVYPIPEVDFDMAPYVCAGEEIVFTNMTVGITVSEWDFGDSNTSTAINPSHIYDTPGTYTVSLTGYSASENCPATITKDVLVRGNPAVDLALDMTNGCAPLTIQFQNTSPATTFSQWDFGDGSSAVMTNPSHTYTTPGTYAATLTNIDDWGCSTDTSILNIIVQASPVAAFTPDVEFGCSTSSGVTFNNSSTDATAYVWDFDNGITSQFPSPEVIFNNPGVYDVSLTATNPFGCEDILVQQFEVFDAPMADFSLFPDEGCEDLEVQFFQEAANADSYTWEFGDGGSSTAENPIHTYTEPGSYDVSLYISYDSICYDSITISNAVEVLTTPVADFNPIQNGNGWVDFDNTSLDANTYFWDFGDGNTSTEENPTHRYEENGPRVVLLIATNSNGCLDSLILDFMPDYFYGLQVPNAFSPESGVGEVRNFAPQGFGLVDYHIQVFSHWGDLMWESTALDAEGRPTEYWDGVHNGVIAPQGAYVWKVTKAEFLDGSTWQGMDYGSGKPKNIGSLTLLR